MKVAIYTRVSTTKQDYENQLSQLREYCKRQNYEIEAIYKEIISGKEANRPEFKKMLQDAHKKKFDAILVWALDRFTREGTQKVFHYLSLLDSYKVKFISYQEPYFNTDNEMVRDILFSVMGALAKQERIRISERTKAGLQKAVQRGKKLGRPGLKNVDDRIIELHSTTFFLFAHMYLYLWDAGAYSLSQLNFNIKSGKITFINPAPMLALQLKSEMK